MAGVVYCPHCGEWNGHPDGVVMREDGNGAAGPERFGYPEQFWYYCPVCGSETPCCESREAAYEAALRRFTPPQHPMTLDELDALPAPYPVWFQHYGTKVAEPRIKLDVRSRFNVYFDDDVIDRKSYGELWRCWMNKPTKKELESAPPLGRSTGM